MLTTSTIIQGLKNSLPQVSYLTALDIYLWACFLFVFAAVLEYVALNIMVRQRANASFKVNKNEAKFMLKNSSFKSFIRPLTKKQGDALRQMTYFKSEYLGNNEILIYFFGR